MQSSGGGVLRINVVHAKLEKDVEVFGKQDPYVKITYLGTPYKTKVHEGGGKHPVWNETFDISIGSTGDDILFEVKDKDVVGVKMIGSTIIKTSSLCIHGGVRDYFSIHDKEGEPVGSILFEAKFTAHSEIGKNI